MLMHSLQLRGGARAKHGLVSPLWAGTTPRVTLATQSAAKVGSFQPIPVFCPRPNCSSRTTQPQCSSTLSFTRRVNETVNGGVICVFHASVTLFSNFKQRRSTSIDQIGVEVDGPHLLVQREFGPQFALTKLAQGPGSIETLDILVLKAVPRVPQKFEIFRHRNYVFVVVPPLPNLEIP